MNRFEYVRAGGIDEAVQALAIPGARAIAGGTNLVDLMKYDVSHPTRVVDITRLPLTAIEETADGGLKIGALVTNADLAYDPRVAARWPLLASAILAGASGQLRNAATTGGNLLQRTRCYYFYDTATPCNKREPGTGCPARTGVNRIHAILGASESCIATHPSDMCVALAALDAKVHVVGVGGARVIPMSGLHRLPGDAPDRDTTLEAGDLITAVELAAQDWGDRHSYLKVRDRASYAFALASAAAALKVEGGRITAARLALGGVAHKPWRDTDAEALMVGQAPDAATFEAAARHILHDAQGYGGNDFKIGLARTVIVRALSQCAAGTPQSVIDKRVA